MEIEKGSLAKKNIYRPWILGFHVSFAGVFVLVLGFDRKPHFVEDLQRELRHWGRLHDGSGYHGQGEAAFHVVLSWRG